MSHLPEALERIAEADPSIIKIKQVPVGLPVRYHGRSGSMRQGRTSFPATVLKQHPDDGTLDLLVFFEAEDQIWEQRVSPRSETNPGHCWEFIEDSREIAEAIEEIRAAVRILHRAIYGNYNAPEQSVIEIFDIFDRRLTAVEAKLRK